MAEMAERKPDEAEETEDQSPENEKILKIQEDDEVHTVD